MTADGVLATIEAFNEAFNGHDVDAVIGMMTDDVVFENTSGIRFEGRQAVGGVLGRAFELMHSGRFETEEMFVADSRCAVLWTYCLHRDEPARGTVRGVDVYRVQAGKVAEKLSYIKSRDFVQKLGLELGAT